MSENPTFLALAFLYLLPTCTTAAAEEHSLQDCLKMQTSGEDKDKELECYRSLARKEQGTTGAQTGSRPPEHKNPVPVAPPKTELADEWTPSSHPLDVYKQNYLLFYSHSSLPNNYPSSPNPSNRVTSSQQLDNRDLKLQISLKKHLLGQKKHTLWFGYTQQSFWQVYDTGNSRPFRETNYEPELIYSYRPDNWGPVKIFNVGGVHQSNGQSLPRSRSWNRIYIQPGLEYCFGDWKRETCSKDSENKLILLPRLWARWKENPADDDNPDITKYLGHGDIEVRYYHNDLLLSAIGRVHSIQLDLAIPFSSLPLFNDSIKHVNAHMQYFSGYGESLIDYNQSHNTYGFGISVPFE